TAGVGKRRKRPLFLGLAQIVSQTDKNVISGPVRRNLRNILRRNHTAPASERVRPLSASARSARTRTEASPDTSTANRHSLHRQFERGPGARGFDFIRSFF